MHVQVTVFDIVVLLHHNNYYSVSIEDLPCYVWNAVNQGIIIRYFRDILELIVNYASHLKQYTSITNFEVPLSPYFSGHYHFVPLCFWSKDRASTPANCDCSQIIQVATYVGIKMSCGTVML